MIGFRSPPSAGTIAIALMCISAHFGAAGCAGTSVARDGTRGVPEANLAATSAGKPDAPGENLAQLKGVREWLKRHRGPDSPLLDEIATRAGTGENRARIIEAVASKFALEPAAVQALVDGAVDTWRERDDPISGDPILAARQAEEARRAPREPRAVELERSRKRLRDALELEPRNPTLVRAALLLIESTFPPGLDAVEWLGHEIPGLRDPSLAAAVAIADSSRSGPELERVARIALRDWPENPVVVLRAAASLPHDEAPPLLEHLWERTSRDETASLSFRAMVATHWLVSLLDAHDFDAAIAVWNRLPRDVQAALDGRRPTAAIHLDVDGMRLDVEAQDRDLRLAIAAALLLTGRTRAGLRLADSAWTKPGPSADGRLPWVARAFRCLAKGKAGCRDPFDIAVGLLLNPGSSPWSGFFDVFLERFELAPDPASPPGAEVPRSGGGVASSSPFHETSDRVRIPPRTGSRQDQILALSFPRSDGLPEGFVPLQTRADGLRKTVLAASQRMNPTGETSAGGYWLLQSEDGGRSWGRPIYTGLIEFRPWCAPSGVELPPIVDGRVRIAAYRQVLDDTEIGSTGGSRSARFRLAPPPDEGVWLAADMRELQADGDGDGLPDLEEERLGTDPARRDTDGDGLDDGIDPLPTIPAGPATVSGEILSGRLCWNRICRSTVSPEEVGALYVLGDPGQFAGVRQAAGRVVVLTRKDHRAMRDRFGFMRAQSVEILVIDRAGGRAVVDSLEGAVGLVLLLERKGSGWVVTRELSVKYYSW